MVCDMRTTKKNKSKHKFIECIKCSPTLYDCTKMDPMDTFWTDYSWSDKHVLFWTINVFEDGTAITWCADD
jgi:hypothetical protein